MLPAINQDLMDRLLMEFFFGVKTVEKQRLKMLTFSEL